MNTTKKLIIGAVALVAVVIGMVDSNGQQAVQSSYFDKLIGIGWGATNEGHFFKLVYLRSSTYGSSREVITEEPNANYVDYFYDERDSNNKRYQIEESWGRPVVPRIRFDSGFSVFHVLFGYRDSYTEEFKVELFKDQLVAKVSNGRSSRFVNVWKFVDGDLTKKTIENNAKGQTEVVEKKDVPKLKLEVFVASSIEELEDGPKEGNLFIKTEILPQQN